MQKHKSFAKSLKARKTPELPATRSIPRVGTGAYTILGKGMCIMPTKYNVTQTTHLFFRMPTMCDVSYS